MDVPTSPGSKQQGAAETTRVLTVIGRPAIRSAIRYGLSGIRRVEIVGEVVSWQEMLTTVARIKPDVILVGAKILVEIPAGPKNQEGRIPLLVLMPEPQSAFLAAAIDIGARGYVLEDAEPVEIAAALRSAATGHTQWAAADHLHAYHWQQLVGSRWRSLTDRERHVLELIATGMDTASIANATSLTPKTIEHHTSHILEKLDLASRLQAALWYNREIPLLLRTDF